MSEVVCESALKAYLNRVRTRLRSYREGRRRTVYKIVHDERHMSISWLTMENERGVRSLVWDEAISIKAFKRDLWAVDLICLEIELSDGNRMEVNEEMDGWDSLVQKLPEYLPGCTTFGNWFEIVASPAFKLNLTSIFERSLNPKALGD